MLDRTRDPIIFSNGHHKAQQPNDLGPDAPSNGPSSSHQSRGHRQHHHPQQHAASAGKVPPALMPHNHSAASLSPMGEGRTGPSAASQSPHGGHAHHSHDHGRHQVLHRQESERLQLFTKVTDWLQEEMSRVDTLQKRQVAMVALPATAPVEAVPEIQSTIVQDFKSSLQRLGRILEDYALVSDSSRRHRSLSATRRRGLTPGKGSGSDTEQDETYVPSADVYLDNTKTLAFNGKNAADLEHGPALEAWNIFKTDVLRITHTLRLKGWRRLPLDAAPEIEIVRLSGALTNAVYVVSPPTNMREVTSSGLRPPRLPPAKLLLRVYGPQVGHLIDREKELGILRRLGRQNIGAKLLGTFNNGRFEQYLEARPLTKQEMRKPDMSMNIAKRMRELHDGIDLLPEERRAGPSVFRNWDKWLHRLGKVATWLDLQLCAPENERISAFEPWRRRGYVLGAPWLKFREAYFKYRAFLEACSGGKERIMKYLVFAHNDTQYGNILRMVPTNHSPLLLPANEHRQLVVIDFEYASANLRGLDFANHFTEWCYNYHDEETPWQCVVDNYPKPEAQARFIRAYLSHRPYAPGSMTLPVRETGASASPPSPDSSQAAAAAGGPLATPMHDAALLLPPRMPEFTLDESTGSAATAAAAIQADLAIDADMLQLMRESRLWRPVNSAQWAAWGVLQAKVPSMREKEGALSEDEFEAASAGTEGEPVKEEEEEEVFDYLAYAQDRALFFWADLYALGIVSEADLPAETMQKVKARVIDY
ncbi:hypothetical protein KEM52_005871 [Ascosphaera acerosa]|nr:hypothetical protein KEM52_005871 [Ascosphaera acerosa]